MDFIQILANECRKHRGRIAIEWPKGCEYWRAKRVKQYTHDPKLNKVHINGCALGLTDDERVPILKPWTIATDDPYVQGKLQDKLSPGKVEHPVRTPVAGKYTKIAEIHWSNGQANSQRLGKELTSQSER